MFCPNCKAEYREGFNRCSECGVALVNELPETEADPQSQIGMKGEPPVILWSGQDPVAFSVVISALDAANIPYREWQSRDYAASLSQPLALGFYGMPHWEVRVFARDLESARKTVGAALRPLTLVRNDSDNQELGDEADLASGESTQPPVASHNGRTAAQAEIWSGTDEGLVQLFRSALLENFIPCWELTASNGDIRLFVSSDEIARAREIIQKAQAA